MTGGLIPKSVVVEYEGAAAIGDSGRARLHDRERGVGGMVWDALDGAGWVGEPISLRATVDLRVGVTPAPVNQQPPHRPESLSLDGRRRFIEGGWIDDAGVVWQQYIGPLKARAAGPGFRLENEDVPELLGDDMLRAAAAHAGWSASSPNGSVEIPKVRVAVAVARRKPKWEAYAADPEGTPWTSVGPINEGHSPGDQAAVGQLDERSLVTRAREVAARAGEPDPELIQHALGARFDLTRTTGSVVFSDAPSCIVVMEGNFRTRRPQPPPRLADGPDGEEFVSYPFQILVFDLATGAITDSGSSRECPDLTPLGDVVTDNDARC